MRSSVSHHDLKRRVRPSDWQYLRRLMPYLWRQRGALWTAALLFPVDALSATLPPFLLGRMLDRGIAQGNVPLLYGVAALYLLSLTVEFTAGFFSEYLVTRLGQRALSEVRDDLFCHLQRLPLSYFSHVPVGKTVTRVTSDVEALGEIFATGAISVVSDVLTLVTVVATMLWLSPKLTAAAFLLVPMLVLVATVAQKYARRAFTEIRRHLAGINAFLAEHIGVMSVVQIYGQQERTQAEFAGLNAAYRDANHRAIAVDATLYALVEAIGTAAVAATVAWGAGDLAAGGISAGVLVAFIQYIRRFFVPIRDLSTKYTVLQGAFAAAERIFSLLGEPVTLADAPEARSKPTFDEAIRLEDVSFRFDAPGAGEGAGDEAAEADRWVLRHVDLTIKKGERIGLVGPTGSGKTSLLGLLNRTHDVRQGRVSIDGEDVRALKVADVRRLFAVVLQDPSLFRGTLRDNLKLADRMDVADIERALEAVEADDLVSSREGGLDADVGIGGEQLSAGERQVLSLARALALKAPILLMDEATSHIDTPTEARLQQAIESVMAERTAVIVAHRLSTIRRVDRVLVLERGRIVQQGPPDVLARCEGPFRSLIEKSDRADG